MPVQMAIQLSMIVEITSCAPGRRFQEAGDPAPDRAGGDRGDDAEKDVQRARDTSSTYEPMITAA